MTLAERHYERARERLGLDRDADEAAAQQLAALLAHRAGGAWGLLASQLEGRDVTVLGAASVERGVAMEPNPLIVAGSAVSTAVRRGWRATAVVTDLDGELADLMALAYDGAIVVVHAHGDNSDALADIVAQLPYPPIGTCQTPPPEGSPLWSHGGFTDGDRACFLAAALGARSVRLVGFDWDHPVPDTPEKRAKLALARELVAEVPIPVIDHASGALVSTRTHSS